jgi:hypothetical protein
MNVVITVVTVAVIITDDEANKTCDMLLPSSNKTHQSTPPPSPPPHLPSSPPPIHSYAWPHLEVFLDIGRETTCHWSHTLESPPLLVAGGFPAGYVSRCAQSSVPLIVRCVVCKTMTPCGCPS